jgi:hypothetical protein
MNKRELWLRIANYHFEHLVPTSFWDEIAAKFGGQNPFTKAFIEKLSRKLNWDKAFTLKAIWEYKKFVYLGVISDFSVTPSKIIDQVWHEHILFSSGYRKFCEEIIQMDFDHNPDLGNMNNQVDKYKSQYFQTINLYKNEFGFEPPEEIWGKTKFKEKKEKLNVLPETANNDSAIHLLLLLSPDERQQMQSDSGDSGSDNNSFFDFFDNGSDSDSSCSSSCGD